MKIRSDQHSYDVREIPGHARFGRSGRLAALTLCVVLLGGCSSGSSDDSSTPARGPSECRELAGEVADLVVDLADHAAVDAAGIPLGDVEATHPDEVDIWEIAGALASDVPALRKRVEALAGAEQEAGCEPGWAHSAVNARAEAAAAQVRDGVNADAVERRQYVAANLLAIFAANLAPPAEHFAVPAGFPPEFPVHPEAELSSSELGDEGSVDATWTVEGVSFEEVSDYYSQQLQDVRLGGWTLSESSGTGGGGGDEGRLHHQVEGYGFVGEVTVETESPRRVTVRATLAPAPEGPYP